MKRPPGASLSAVRIVPNPYNLSADPSVRFGDRDDKLAFYELPGEAEIRIYTELGELVEVLVHDDGSGDEFWDLTTSQSSGGGERVVPGGDQGRGDGRADRAKVYRDSLACTMR